MSSEAITRNDLTAILNAVLPANDHYLQSWEYVSNVGSNIFNGDWVATDDGIIVMRGNVNTSGAGAYWYVTDATLNCHAGQLFWDSANGTSKTTAFPVIKGHTYRTGASSAMWEADCFFYKFVLKGGVSPRVVNTVSYTGTTDTVGVLAIPVSVFNPSTMNLLDVLCLTAGYYAEGKCIYNGQLYVRIVRYDGQSYTSDSATVEVSYVIQ